MGEQKQCAIVNFVEGTNSNTPSACTNSTGVTADYTNDAELSKLVGEHVETPAPSGDDGKESAGVVVRGGGLVALGAAVVAGVMML